MEHLITNLVKNFEDGKIDRRQLITRLLAAASAASLGGSPARASESSLKATGVNHISYLAKDYRKTRDFYSDLLGMKVVDDSGTLCRLYAGDFQVIVRSGPVGGKT